jgi:hypothetical protein
MHHIFPKSSKRDATLQLKRVFRIDQEFVKQGNQCLTRKKSMSAFIQTSKNRTMQSLSFSGQKELTSGIPNTPSAKRGLQIGKQKQLSKSGTLHAQIGNKRLHLRVSGKVHEPFDVAPKQETALAVALLSHQTKQLVELVLTMALKPC